MARSRVLPRQFLDFVIPRMLEVEPGPPSGPGAEHDTEWHTHVDLVLQPNPLLPTAHQRVVELDYGMSAGEVTVSCRQALLFYTLRQLRFDSESTHRPKSQQVVLKNRSQIEQFLVTAERGSPDNEGT